MQKKLSQLPLIPEVSAEDCCEVSKYLGNAAYTSSRATMAQVSNFTMAYRGVQVGIIDGVLFDGNPKIFQVNFPSPYNNSLYSITITGEDARSWTVGNKTTNGFVVSSNSNIPLAGQVYWRTEKI